MRAGIGLAVGLAFCAACASPQPTSLGWQKPGGSPEELEDTKQACAGRTLGEQSETGSEWVEARVVGNRFVACMKEHGWSRVEKTAD